MVVTFDQLNRATQRLGDYVDADQTIDHIELVVCGGYITATHFRSRDQTRGLDHILCNPCPKTERALHLYLKTVTKKLQLPPDWFTTDVLSPSLRNWPDEHTFLAASQNQNYDIFESRRGKLRLLAGDWFFQLIASLARITQRSSDEQNHKYAVSDAVQYANQLFRSTGRTVTAAELRERYPHRFCQVSDDAIRAVNCESVVIYGREAIALP